MAKTFQARATLTGISSKVDGGLSLRFVTKELTPDEKLTALEFQNTYGWVLFRENEFKPEDVPAQDADVFGKSLSQRLRDVLFVWWTQLPEPRPDFIIFYKHQMEQRINDVKSKLD
jgi:hypothetical protein